MRIMDNYLNVIVIGLISILATPTCTLAEELLSKDNAVRQALQQNPRLTIAEQQQLAAQAQLDVNRGKQLPQLDLSYQARRSDNPLDVFADKLNTRSVNPVTDFSADSLNEPDASTLQMARLSLVWPVFTGGETIARVRAAQARAESAGYGHNRARAQITHGTLTAYLQTQAAAKNLAQLNDAVDAAQRHVTTTRKLVNEGRIIASDKLTAEVFLSSVQTIRERAREKLNQARAGLAQILGRENLTGVQLDTWNSSTTDGNTDAELDDLEQIWQKALNQRQDLAALKSSWNAAKEEVSASRAAYSPKLNLVANHDWYEGEDSWSIAGIVSFNLYDGGGTQHGVDATRAQATEKEAELREKRLNIRHELAEAHARYTGAAKRVHISSDHITKAQNSVEQITRRYGQGRTILIDVLQAERALMEIRSQKLAAVLDLGLARLDLKLADGSLMHTYIDTESK